ncbi:ferredoxin [Streptomyces sp. NPDC056231]|uniref:ferredoxin n=1 Tax=Streptomyces sp. NPDC056231 TaxID=3345755 RepID=UPI003AAAD5F8
MLPLARARPPGHGGVHPERREAGGALDIRKGHGLCAGIVPELIRLGPDDRPALADTAVPIHPRGRAQRAVRRCPAPALRIEQPPMDRPALPPASAGRLSTAALVGLPAVTDLHRQEAGAPNKNGRGGVFNFFGKEEFKKEQQQNKKGHKKKIKKNKKA